MTNLPHGFRVYLSTKIIFFQTHETLSCSALQGKRKADQIRHVNMIMKLRGSVLVLYSIKLSKKLSGTPVQYIKSNDLKD